MIPYIDVRGPVPILIVGFKGYRLNTFTRKVNVWQAIEYLKENGEL